MARGNSKSKPKWLDVKAKLAEFDRAGLLGIIQDLYAANVEHQTFLHTRFGLGEDVLEAYKQTIDRWIWPDVIRNQDVSVAKAKQAISSYTKAGGKAAGLVELMVFYCEQAVGFSLDVGYQDGGYFDALVRMFERALEMVPQLEGNEQGAFIKRLRVVCDEAEVLGYGVGEALEGMMAKRQ